MHTLTWARESNGLFDFESRTLFRKTFTATATSHLLRLGNDCHLQSESHCIDPKAAVGLAWLVRYESSLYLDGFLLKPETTDDQLWMVVPPTKKVKPGAGHRLVQGDVIRLGRMAFTITQLSPSGSDLISFSSSILPTHMPPQLPDSDKTPCRICLSDTATDFDPLISPCKCAGTMRLIHLKCLREWLRSRMQVKLAGSIASYYWKSLDCELCKEKFPMKAEIGGVVVDVFDVKKPESPFLVLEDSREHNPTGGFHVVTLASDSTVALVRGR